MIHQITHCDTAPAMLGSKFKVQGSRLTGNSKFPALNEQLLCNWTNNARKLGSKFKVQSSRLSHPDHYFDTLTEYRAIHNVKCSSISISAVQARSTTLNIEQGTLNDFEL